METLYLWCAVGAGTLFAAQTAMTLIGLGDTDLDMDVDLDLDFDLDVDVDLDTGGDFDSGGHGGHDARFVSWMSIKAIISAVCIFGLVGLTGGKTLDPVQTMFMALAAGAATMYSVGWLIHSMHKLQADGSVHVESALGTTGVVYLTIPASNQGVGKVTVEVQGRTMEYEAVTEGDALPTGTPVEIVRVVKSDIVEVWPADAVAAI